MSEGRKITASGNSSLTAISPRNSASGYPVHIDHRAITVCVDYEWMLPLHLADSQPDPSFNIRGSGSSLALSAETWISFFTPHSLAMRAIVRGPE